MFTFLPEAAGGNLIVFKVWPDLFQWKYLGRGTGNDFLAADTGDFPRLSLAASLQSKASEYLPGLRAGWTEFKVTIVHLVQLSDITTSHRDPHHHLTPQTSHLKPHNLPPDWEIFLIFMSTTEKSQGNNKDGHVDTNHPAPC